MFSDKRIFFLTGLIIVQAFCAAVFVTDVIHESAQPSGLGFHLVIEAVATLGLIFAIVIEIRYFRDLLRQNSEQSRSLRVATGALGDVITDYFGEWGLTPSERDVALFAIKGMSNTEIAGLRGSSEGTIKAHLNAVFRKAGVSGRNQLISLLVEDLMGQSLLEGGQGG